MFVLRRYCIYTAQSRDCVADSQNQESYEFRFKDCIRSQSLDYDRLHNQCGLFRPLCMLRLSLATQLSEKAHEDSDNTIVIAFVRWRLFAETRQGCAFAFHLAAKAGRNYKTLERPIHFQFLYKAVFVFSSSSEIAHLIISGRIVNCVFHSSMHQQPRPAVISVRQCRATSIWCLLSHCSWQVQLMVSNTRLSLSE